ncbi:hypothetical protein GCM10010431_84820 [Streptomyces kunmingensis]
MGATQFVVQLAAQVSPAQEWNVDSIGPAVTPLRRPLPEGVAWPNPKVLSRQAHRKTEPVRMRGLPNA